MLDAIINSRMCTCCNLQLTAEQVRAHHASIEGKETAGKHLDSLQTWGETVSLHLRGNAFRWRNRFPPEMSFCNAELSKGKALRSTGLGRWYINITLTIMDMGHRSVFYLEYDASATGCSLSIQMEPARAWGMDNFQNCDSYIKDINCSLLRHVIPSRNDSVFQLASIIMPIWRSLRPCESQNKIRSGVSQSRVLKFQNVCMQLAMCHSSSIWERQ
jgi:hypothetical protein